eukprot:TRINITY_DN254_c0_g1_i1.p1 TRINITY_DN254_c0_g1~~TRINITY_DN254_c0_g1_i1.p1  ORF type:complete len:468 (-),score=144.88 TRINITY_DN254_c0_g1_i1:356-1759(-)
MHAVIRAQQQKRKQQAGAPAASTAVLRGQDMESIRKLLEADHGPVGSAAASDAAATTVRAQERRERMLAADATRREQLHQKDHVDGEKEEARTRLRNRARRMVAEDCDEVRSMNALMAHAKAVAIRDAQITEKKKIQAEERDAEAAMDSQIEEERIRALRLYEERETHRADERRRGAAVIRVQMAEREAERRRDLERKQLEQQLLSDAMEDAKREAQDAQGRRAEAARQVVRDVAAANQVQVTVKMRKLEEEREEDRRIREWLEAKDARDAALMEEERRQKKAREEEVARLRAQQQKQIDAQAMHDELRARRYQEDRDREWRRQQVDEAAKRRTKTQELLESRHQQLQVKQADRQKQEEEAIAISRSVRQQAEEAAEVEAQRRMLQTALKQKACDELKRQIEERRARQRLEREEEVEEGRKLQAMQREHAALVRKIQEEKMAELEELNLPGQYRSSLLRFKATKPRP